MKKTSLLVERGFRVYGVMFAIVEIETPFGLDFGRDKLREAREGTGPASNC